MSILFSSSYDDANIWRAELKKHLPKVGFHTSCANDDDLKSVEYALVWAPPAGELARYPNLKAIFSLGAGVDHLFEDADLPDVPIIRLVDDNLTHAMTEYVVHWVLHFHRGFHLLRLFQEEHKWHPLTYPNAASRRVGILGVGELGTHAAKALVSLGFNVAGWSRSKKNIPGVRNFYGDGALISFFKRTDILVCLLPLTPATRRIINAKTLAALPKGAFFINAARGRLVAEEDLRAALDSGRLSAAALDVFHQEPLPEAHPFWSHPRILVTPHTAAITAPIPAAKNVADNIRRIQKGQAPLHQINRDLSY